MNTLEQRVMMTIYEINEDLDYSNYESDEIAAYLKLETPTVAQICRKLLAEGYLEECMTYDDDGADTFILSQKGLLALGLEV
jgi:Mn-dependent DtxR family transcriptional regulator